MEVIAAIAAVIAALGAFGSGIAAVVSAIQASRGKRAATEARDLVRQVIAFQQTNTQKQNVIVSVPVTVGNLAVEAPKELTFPVEAVPVNAPELPAPQEPIIAQAQPPVPPVEGQ